jgi:V8-like Glu-specific endopeptidase
VALSATIVACLAVVPATVGAESPSRVGAGIVDRVDASAGNVRSYWTPARMRGAEPARVLAPRTRGASVARANEAAANATRRGGGRPQIAKRVDHLKKRPTSAHGKVFFRAGRYDYACSGTAVRAPSRSLVLTAAHCAFVTDILGLANQVHDWEFVPAYDRGRKPFGAWPAVTLAAPAGWVASRPTFNPWGEIEGGDSRYDVGAATVARHRQRTLGSVVGTAKPGFGRLRHQRYTAFGYPAARPFDGRREYACASSYRGSDPTFAAPAPIRISCDMTAGASGGGWIDGKGRLLSVTSYAYTDNSTALYGPFFGAAIRDFYDSVR